MTNILTIIGCALFAFCIYIFIKIENEFIQEMKVLHAVHDYLTDKDDEISTGDILTDIKNIETMFDSIGYYKPKLFRLIDWSYTNIVPPDVLEKIKPYIKG